MRYHEITEAATPVIATPEFQRWFSGSKLVHPDGSPIVFYHGTSKDQDFKAFKAPKNGIWFTASREEASTYAVENDSMGHKYDHYTGRFNPVNVAPRVIPVFLRATNPVCFPQLPDDLRNLNAGNSGVGYRRGQGDFFQRLRVAGHDGMWLTEPGLVVVFEPTQVKSAIGNKRFDAKKKGIAETRPA